MLQFASDSFDPRPAPLMRHSRFYIVRLPGEILAISGANVLNLLAERRDIAIGRLPIHLRKIARRIPATAHSKVTKKGRGFSSSTGFLSSSAL